MLALALLSDLHLVAVLHLVLVPVSLPDLHSASPSALVSVRCLDSLSVLLSVQCLDSLLASLLVRHSGSELLSVQVSAVALHLAFSLALLSVRCLDSPLALQSALSLVSLSAPSLVSPLEL